MIFLTAKRQAELQKIIKYAVVAGAWHHDEILLERDQSNDERIRTIQGFIEQELSIHFHQEPWYRRIFRRRTKKCKPIPCPPVQTFEFREEVHGSDLGTRP